MDKLEKVRLGWLTRHLVPNTGTLIVLALFFLVQSVVARPPAMPATPETTATLLSYQGTLTYSSGTLINGDVEMVFDLYHEAEGGTSFWTEAYTGAQAIEVTSGQFHVLLGSQVALEPSDLTGDLYLGITVNGEKMLPRELLASAARAVEASTLVAGATTGGSLTVSGKCTVNDQDAHQHIGRHDPTCCGDDQIPAGDFRGFTTLWDSDAAMFGLRDYGDDRKDIVINTEQGDNIRFQIAGADKMMVSGSGNVGIGTASPETLLHVKGGNAQFDNGQGLVSASGAKLVSGSGGGTWQTWPSDGEAYSFMANDVGGAPVFGIQSTGDVNVYGHTVKNCGALVEANLQTPEELAAEQIARFDEGDVLCWAGERLERCSTANDSLVQAVADVDGLPIVIGAEVIRVLGPVRYGDLLVASDVPGYAMVNNDPRNGSVIAQALEDFDGGQGLIRAMIRKF